ncbi:DUF4238 domain-containing protein [Cellulophaga baltica]|uniref:DUF4238 domain-containing protein n=1 Tax=Cellulophaga baltica TaxID=76594 RepID=UPI002493D812|nr:DUF4238 domain-containing protein [Cellulophaga baltica]
MKNPLIKKQHYVWREYLRKWSINDQIPTLFLDIKKIEITNLVNVAQKRFFYRFNQLSENEINFLKIGIDDSPEPIKGLLNDLLNVQNRLKEVSNHTNKSVIERLEKNGYERLHTIIESKGKKLIDCKNLDDLKLFDNDNDKSDALIYLTVQYFRTKKRRDDIKNAQLPLSDVIDFDKIFPIMSLIMALGIAYNLFDVESVSYTLLEINNDSTFITADQPVVNLLSELKDENGKTKELEYYYPLSPKHAIKVNFEDHQKKYSLMNPHKDEIDKLNNRIISESNSFVFGRDIEFLKKLHTTRCIKHS